MTPSQKSDRAIPGDRWSLFWNKDGTLGANEITPTWGGGGVEVMRVPPFKGADMEQQTQQMQAAHLSGSDGQIVVAQVPAFPNNPDLVRLPDGRLFGNGMIGYGVSYLTYGELAPPFEASPGQ